MGDRRPGHGRYAHIEREQRWLCDAVPAGAEPVCSILDRYIDETRLRLRRRESSEGVVYKLGQKVRRTDERRVGTGCVSTCGSRWSRDQKKKKNHNRARRRS